MINKKYLYYFILILAIFGFCILFDLNSFAYSNNELMYSLVDDGYGNWETDNGEYLSEYEYYNCYSYVLGIKYCSTIVNGFDDLQNPSIDDFACLVEDDLESRGYSIIYSGENMYNNLLTDNQVLICFKVGRYLDKDLYDYHFMKYMAGDWYHKPGNSAILKYNSNLDRDWIGEGWKSSGYSNENLIYDSNIHYIVFEYNLFELNCHNCDECNFEADLSEKSYFTIKIDFNCNCYFRFLINSDSNNVKYRLLSDYSFCFENNRETNDQGYLLLPFNNFSIEYGYSYFDIYSNLDVDYIQFYLVSGNNETFNITCEVLDEDDRHLDEKDSTYCTLNYNENISQHFHYIANGLLFNKISFNLTGMQYICIEYTIDCINELNINLSSFTIYTNNVEIDPLYYYSFYNNGSNHYYCFYYVIDSGYHYANICLQSITFSGFYAKVSPLTSSESMTLDLNTLGYTNESVINIFNNNSHNLYKFIEIEQPMLFDIQLNTNILVYEPTIFFIFKINENMETYYFSFQEDIQYLFENIKLSTGRYIVGYLGTSNVEYTINFTRRVSLYNNMNSDFILDYNYGNVGSDSRINHNSNLQTITEGFTRCANFINCTGNLLFYNCVDYNFYSDNDQILYVSDWGTILALPVSEDQVATIYAISKDNPSLVYSKSITVKDDSENINSPIICELYMMVMNEELPYQVELIENRVPFPFNQYYSWTISEYYYGFFLVNEYCIVSGHLPNDVENNCIIYGTYLLNQRVSVVIHFYIDRNML